MTANVPAPASNFSAVGLRDRAVDVVTATTVLVTAGDYTGNGAGEDVFTLASHGLKTGDRLHVLHQSAMGGVTGGVGTYCLAKYVSSSVFQITDLDGTVIENTADATVMFLKGEVSTALVTTAVLPNLIVAAGDYTGGATEDIFGSATTGLGGIYEGNALKLLYKSAAGVLTGIAAGTTVYAKTPTTVDFHCAATNGGAIIENTADGTAVFLRTS